MLVVVREISGRSGDAYRSARLTLDREVQAGLVTNSAVAEAVVSGGAGGRHPAIAMRFGQRLAQRAGLLDGISSMFRDAVAVRRALLGEETGGPRFLIRVDEFPCASSWRQPEKYGVAASRAFHEVLTESGVSYLMAVVARPAVDPLDPTRVDTRELEDAENDLLAEMRHDGVTFGQHGVTHRTRFSSPRRRSELGGLGEDVGALMDEGRALLCTRNIETSVLVPPFNRFDATQWPTLACRYRVVTGGPESVRIVGAQATPSWWGDAVYLPCYAPLYADAATILRALERVFSEAAGCWVPLVLHSGWEIDDDLISLRDLADQIAPFTVHWSEFLDAVDRSGAIEPHVAARAP